MYISTHLVVSSAAIIRVVTQRFSFTSGEDRCVTTPITAAEETTHLATKMTHFLYWQVCRVGANFPCKPEQIHWHSTVGKRPKCFDCPDCPPGTEPSVPCGTSINDWRDIHCVSCKLGKTYSDKYTSQCKACTICSNGKAVENNCTLATNSKCGSKCGLGFYTVPFIFGCLPCAQCCGDGKDEFATECSDDKKKCKVRSTPCTRVQTTPLKPTKGNSSSSNTSPTVQTAGERTTTVREEENSVFGQLSTSIVPTSKVQSEKKDRISMVILLIIAVALCVCVVLFISVIVERIMMSHASRSNISQGGTPPLPHLLVRFSQDSATPLLVQSESPLLNGSASPQHLLHTALHTNEVVPQANESGSPESNRSTSPHYSDSLSSRERAEYETPQPNISRSGSPGTSESALSQPDGSASTHSNQSAAAADRFNRSAREPFKSNPGE